jgi:membrane protease YdiL (CAAX protease family)
MPDSPPSVFNNQHPLLKSVLLHILPGLLVALVFVLLKPFIDRTSYPPLLAFLLAVLFIDIPVMLWIMFAEGKKMNGRYNLKGVVLFRDKVSWKAFLLIFVGAFLVIYLLVMLVTPVSAYLTQRLSTVLPSWVFLDEQSQYQAYLKNILVAVFTLQLVLTGIILPWVEELYFRGFLLPRINRYGKWAPLLGGLLFGLYHVWQIYSFPTVFLMGTALGYIAWWKKDIRLPLSLHVWANVLSRVVFLMAALAM